MGNPALRECQGYRESEVRWGLRGRRAIRGRRESPALWDRQARREIVGHRASQERLVNPGIQAQKGRLAKMGASLITNG